MLTPNDFRPGQRDAEMHCLYHPDAMLWMGLGSGKEQPVSEPVLTPTGWTPIGDIAPGDFVIGADGNPTRVMAVFPQGTKPVVKVTMSDGSWTRCGWEHLWTVKTLKDLERGKDWRTVSLREVNESGVDSGTQRKWRIPQVSPVNHSEKTFLIDPYRLGVILGDGCASPFNCRICTDLDVAIRAGAEAIRPHETSKYTVYAVIRGTKVPMEKLGLLGKRSWEKFVPSEYFLGSPYQRLSLLQGLLDTDGSADVKGGVEFSSTSEPLADAVVELTESLGGVAVKSGPRTTKYDGKDGRPSWRVRVKLPSHLNPFSLPRKLDKWVRPTKYPASRRIKSIEELCYSEESVCIKVESKDQLYITRHHIVTHNTAVALTVLVDRMRAGQVQKCIVFGPLRVIQSVWHVEARKWSHLQHLRFSVIHGTRQQRRRALFANADVFLVNYENLNWLAEELSHYYTSRGDPLPFQMAVYDEVTKVKNSTSVRINGGKRDIIDPRTKKETTIKRIGWRTQIDNFQYRIGLTGTPSPNGYVDLHGQFLVVDGGARLGPRKSPYLENYFTKEWNGWGNQVTAVGRQIIEAKISDIVINQETDRSGMPDVLVKDIMVDLPPKALEEYKRMEKQMFSELDEGKVEVFSAGAASTKCRQIASGNVYASTPPTDDEADTVTLSAREWYKVHDAKMAALEEVIEDANGQPVLVSYAFKPEAARIMQKFKALKPVNMTQTPANQTESVIRHWREGRTRIMLGHAASMGHGIDGLQDTGHIIVWYGLPWSWELYSQLNARLDRPGQKSVVSIVRILANQTVDQAIVKAVEGKRDDEASLRAAIQNYRTRQVSFM